MQPTQDKQCDTALVIGGLRGIGLSISRHFAAAGYRVFATTRNSGEATAAENFPVIRKLTLDVNDPVTIEAARQQLEELAGTPKVLIANAGIIHDELFPLCDFEKWQHVVMTNLIGNVRTIRAFLPGMVKARAGRILIVSSISGIRGNIGQTAYGASKGGLVAFGKALAREVGRFGINVNAVSPGIIAGEMSATIPQDKREQKLANAALRREGNPADVAALLLALCGPAGDYVTGQNIVIDGGIVMQ